MNNMSNMSDISNKELQQDSIGMSEEEYELFLDNECIDRSDESYKIDAIEDSYIELIETFHSFEKFFRDHKDEKNLIRMSFLEDIKDDGDYLIIPECLKKSILGHDLNDDKFKEDLKGLMSINDAKSLIIKRLNTLIEDTLLS